jgi:phosphatidylglycerophosphate synthase
MTTANKITIVRLLLIPIFVLLGVYYGNSVFIGEPQLWFPVLVIGRDFVIVAGSFGLHYVNGDVHVSPRWTGKVATVFQMASIAWVMLQFQFIKPLVLVTLAGLFTFVSGAAYVADGIRQLQRAERSLAEAPLARPSIAGAHAKEPAQP